jgi:phenylalanyl-tRNA synthetase beta chain
VAALTGETVREPDATYDASGPAIEARTSVEIQDADLCPRYTAGVIDGITVQPSPAWMQEALVAAGQRPINNVVDVTNYVMLEMGQPLHAFDFEKLGGGRIIVRRATAGESIRLIDDSTHKLTTDNLVIADADQAVAVAGVMGSGGSEVSESTTVVLLEAATFVGPNNRRTSAALKKRTEASQRFEKGLSVELAMAASKRAMKLLLETGGGTADAGHVDAFPGDGATVHVDMPRARLTQVLGVEVEETRVVAILESLGFVVRTSEAAYSVDVPYWRSDVRIADDVVEEIARIIGYDNLPSVALSGSIPDPEPQPLLERREAIRDALAAAGFREVINYSATNETTRALAPSVQGERAALRLLNPMSSERDELRTSLRAGVLQNFGSNARQQRGALGLFEVGKVFWPREGDLPEERLQLVVVYGGNVGGNAHQADVRQVDFFDLKGVVEGLAQTLRTSVDFGALETPDPSLVEGVSASVTADGQALGVLGQVRPDVAARFDVDGPLFLLELDVTALSALAVASTTVGSLSRFPSVEEDLAIVVAEDVPAATVAALLTRQKLVESVALFDVYRGEQIEAGKKSLAYAVSYRAGDRTLTEKDVTRVRRGIVKQLEREFGASLRDS